MQGTCVFRMDIGYDASLWKLIEKRLIEVKPDIDSKILFQTRKWCTQVKLLGLPAPTKVHARDKNTLELEWHYRTGFMLVTISLDFRSGYNDFNNSAILAL
jgi:hypothetical protein